MARSAGGALALLVGLPLLLAGATLWVAMQHRDASGGYTAAVAPIQTEGHAVVAADVDALLGRAMPVARADQTTLRVSARSEAGATFLGLAPAADVGRYLADVPYTRVDEVRLARGPLPVEATPVAGETTPAPPGEQSFWMMSNHGTGGALEWTPADLRGQPLALVVMAPDGQPMPLVDLTAQLRPEWLVPSVWGLLGLGTVLVLVALVAMLWPVRAREVIYVVPPAQVPEIAARLGLPYGASLAVAAVSATAGAPAPGASGVAESGEGPAAGPPGQRTAAPPSAGWVEPPGASPDEQPDGRSGEPAGWPRQVDGDEPADQSVDGSAQEPVDELVAAPRSVPPAWPPPAAGEWTTRPVRVADAASGGIAGGKPVENGAALRDPAGNG